MDRIRIRGGNPIRGKIAIAGAKNAALPLMVASLLTEDIVRLSNVPDLADIKTLMDLLMSLGVTVEMAWDKNSAACRTLALNAKNIGNLTAEYDLVRKMRASVLVLGPLVARFGEAKVSLPGGCAIGTRPVNLHLAALKELGAEIEIEAGYIHARAPKGLKGGVVRFPTVTVGGTEHLLMAAALAKGETVLENAACEPEIGDLAKLLVAMGAEIEGAGSSRIVIRGKPRLRGASHRVVADRIEAGTYAIAAAITGGRVEIGGAGVELLGAVVESLVHSGVEVALARDSMIVAGNGGMQGVDISTAPFPGFPTDMQAQMMALMATASGASVITETIFENRFMHVPELARMGADITVKGNTAVVRGVKTLKGAPVMATDLRASVSLVLAGLAAQGETMVNRVYHLDRGYQSLDQKLRACGADIERVPG
ncbi:MAG: UDP-N-acetylglucosamine 1-carboxyvinyltransferase [Alphaproteobacteria bacterium]|nr:UDP-N-acetylglucosamine 1-carboxyvinyltransferase [Alphaproteobacteria bacterium]